MGTSNPKHADRGIHTHCRKTEFPVASDPPTGPTAHIQKPRPSRDPGQCKRTPNSAKLQVVDEVVEPQGSKWMQYGRESRDIRRIAAFG